MSTSIAIKLPTPRVYGPRRIVFTDLPQEKEKSQTTLSTNSYFKTISSHDSAQILPGVMSNSQAKPHSDHDVKHRPDQNVFLFLENSEAYKCPQGMGEANYYSCAYGSTLNNHNIDGKYYPNPMNPTPPSP